MGDLVQIGVMFDGWATTVSVAVVIAYGVWRWQRRRELRRAARLACRDLSQNLSALGVYHWRSGNSAVAPFWESFVPSTDLFALYAPVLIDRQPELSEGLILIHRLLNAAQAGRPFDEYDRSAAVERTSEILRALNDDAGAESVLKAFTKDYGPSTDGKVRPA